MKTDNLRNWASILDDATREQARRTATLGILRAPLALMPDAHLGQGATIGSVLVTDDAVVPAAVGVDIGCGMAARRLDARECDVEDGGLLRWHRAMRKLVPAGLGRWHGTPLQGSAEWLAANPPSSRLEKVNPARNQLGTLGSGNHFIELSVDEVGNLWLLLHSGSRGAGNQLARLHSRVAQELTGEFAPDRDLAWIADDVPAFREYLADLDWSQRYAVQNRTMLLMRAHMAVEAALDRDIRATDEIDCHHNYAVREFVVDLGRKAYVTRKGAIRAGYGDRGLIPGAMGQASFIVRGLGSPKSYESCSHGAGRVLSRTRARREIPLNSFEEAMRGVAWQRDDASVLLDEHPAAYKPVEQVMTDQADLIEIEHRLRAVANYKGVERQTRRCGGARP
jgi:tRNA-splicing ligase RtcB (3'-phosphate/5'-hydroxy nucleic acid ligase)